MKRSTRNYTKPRIDSKQVKINFFSSSFRTTDGDLLAAYCGQCSQCAGCGADWPCEIKSC